MEKKILAAVLAAALLLGCAPAYGSGGAAEKPFSGFLESWHDLVDGAETERPQDDGGGNGGVFGTIGAHAASVLSDTVPSSVDITVESTTGDMTVERPEWEASIPMGDPDTWTIFVYLCGTDLESDGGGATMDLWEMVGASHSDRVRFVVETGGTRHWYNSAADPKQNDRLLIQNGMVRKVEECARSGMGRSSTLADFLIWGIQNYASEHMGLILWNHGGGSISGVCFDERDWYDSLSLLEMDAALLSAADIMTDRFEFIGLDACLMSTVETANILASYADYMIASQESEPGTGWDYAAIGNYLAGHPDADGEALGRVICDSFYASCERDRIESFATLAVVDLRRLDELLVCFNSFAENMYAESEDPTVLSAMVREIRSADNFGGNNRVEGYTNMVDMGAMISACAPWSAGAEEALAALSGAVVYAVQGADHKNASGLSIYYPLEIQGSQELATFSEICVSPYYLSFVDRQSHGSVSGGDTEDYDSDTWFSDGLWNWLHEYVLDHETGYYEYDEEPDEYWYYVDDFEQTGESALITFDVEPQLDEDGTYYFVLSDEGRENAADIYACVFELSADGEDIIELGMTYDVEVDWDSGYAADYFDGYWLSLPDGQNLALYIVAVTDDYIIYTSPILLNGEMTNLRMRQDWNGKVTVEGAWDGIYDSGASDKEVIRLQDGDEIVPIWYSYTVDDLESGAYQGEPYTVQGTPEIVYDMMEAGDYFYAFWIDDIFGDYYLTDFVVFSVEENGDLYFYPD